MLITQRELDGSLERLSKKEYLRLKKKKLIGFETMNLVFCNERSNFNDFLFLL